MDRTALIHRIIDAVKAVPDVKPLLSNKARFVLYERIAYKTQEYFLAQIQGLVRSLYNGQIGGEFIDVMANVISGQIYDAYSKAWTDEGGIGNLPAYLESDYQNFVANQYSFVDKYYRDIVDARIDQTPIEPLLSRAELWSNRWTEAYNGAVRLMSIEMGGKLIWIEGDTINKCDICKSFDGIVAYAKEWDALGIRPQNAPNHILTSLSGDKDAGCQGWRCQCSLEPTDKRRSPNAYGRLEAILLAR